MLGIGLPNNLDFQKVKICTDPLFGFYILRNHTHSASMLSYACSVSCPPDTSGGEKHFTLCKRFCIFAR